MYNFVDYTQFYFISLQLINGRVLHDSLIISQLSRIAKNHVFVVQNQV